MFRDSQNVVLSCVYRTKISLKWLQEILQQHYGECAMKIALVAWVGHRADTQCSLVPLFPVSLLYRTLENFNDAFNFLLTSRLTCVPIDNYCVLVTHSKVLRIYYCITVSRKCEFAALKLLCIYVNVCGALFSVKTNHKEKPRATISGDQSNCLILKACGASNRIQQ